MEIYEYFIIIAFVIAMPCAILYAYHLGKWTYADAISRGMKPRLWTMLVLGSQNNAGLLFYLWKRGTRKNKMREDGDKHKEMAIRSCMGLLLAILLLFIAMGFYIKAQGGCKPVLLLSYG